MITQKIRSTAFVSFNFFGLILIFALGGLIVIVSFILEPLASFIQQRCRRFNSSARLEWCTNETLQLQCLAHEKLGLGTWPRATESVPITETDELLRLLDLADPDHPWRRRYAADRLDARTGRIQSRIIHRPL